LRLTVCKTNLASATMHSVTFLQDLAVVLIVAGLVTLICHRFKQPVVLGYIIAGVIIGPYTPPAALIRDKETIDTLAELGIILLMFSLGLEFNLRKLTRVGMSAVSAALMEILLMFWVGYEIGDFFGWRLLDSIFLGAMLSMSSTTVIIKVLGELGKMKERFAQLVFGTLILEDILGIAMLALLSGIAMTGKLSVGDVALTLGKLGMFLAVTLVAGLISVPRLIGYVSRFKSNEMLIVTVLSLCFGVSLLAVKLGYSAALGAFLIGAVIAEAQEIHRVEALLEPVRDMFSAIFFVAIGLLINPAMLLLYWKPIIVITVAVVLGKVFACSVAVSALTTLLTPYLIKSADHVAGWFERFAPKPLTNSLDLYTHWVGQLGGTAQSPAPKLMRRWIYQMALNCVLSAAVFISAAFLKNRPPEWLQRLRLGEEALKAGLWLAALIISLPLLIATFRKLQALGLLIAETKVNPATAGERTAAIRAIVAQVVPISGSIVLALLILALSSALAPSKEVFAVLIALAVAITWLLWRSSTRIYSKAQAALEETFAQQPPHRPEQAPSAPPSLLQETDLELVTLAPDSSAAGKRIRELELRTRTGASIVGIQRDDTKIFNPDPDEELHPGDQVLLVGTRTQLDLAKAKLAKPVEC